MTLIFFGSAADQYLEGKDEFDHGLISNVSGIFCILASILFVGFEKSRVYHITSNFSNRFLSFLRLFAWAVKENNFEFVSPAIDKIYGGGWGWGKVAVLSAIRYHQKEEKIILRWSCYIKYTNLWL